MTLVAMARLTGRLILQYQEDWLHSHSSGVMVPRTEDISGLPAGDYTVTISDAGGCSADLTATISEPAILSGGLTVNNVFCFGEASGSVDLTVAGGTAPYSFLWDNGATTEDLANVVAGDYNVISN